MQAEEIRRFAGLPLDEELERQARSAPPVAAPMQEHIGRHAGVDDRGAMRAAVAEPQQRA